MEKKEELHKILMGLYPHKGQVIKAIDEILLLFSVSGNEVLPEKIKKKNRVALPKHSDRDWKYDYINVDANEIKFYANRRCKYCKKRFYGHINREICRMCFGNCRQHILSAPSKMKKRCK